MTPNAMPYKKNIAAVIWYLKEIKRLWDDKDIVWSHTFLSHVI